jgi:hypothetical protein
MRIPVWLLSILMTGLLGEQAWLVSQVTQLRSDVAILFHDVHDHPVAAVYDRPSDDSALRTPHSALPSHGSQLLTQNPNEHEH